MTANAATIDWLTEQVLETLDRDGALDPPALTFLLRRYYDGADVADSLGLALAHQLACDTSADPLPRQAEWLAVLAEASAVSDDRRLDRAIAERLACLRSLMSQERHVETLMLAIGSCLVASDIVDAAGILDADTLLSFAVDELERIIAAAYRPGEGLACQLGEAGGPRGRLGCHIRAVAALLTAYRLTARLPYAMLAEELVQFSRRTLWDEAAGGFFEQASEQGASVKPFALNCDAARGLCRLAVLHGTEDYRRAAVLAPGADYARDARRTLEALGSCYRDHGCGAAIYGVALSEWRALQA